MVLSYGRASPPNWEEKESPAEQGDSPGLFRDSMMTQRAARFRQGFDSPQVHRVVEYYSGGGHSCPYGSVADQSHYSVGLQRYRWTSQLADELTGRRLPDLRVRQRKTTSAKNNVVEMPLRNAPAQFTHAA